ncbi:MAG: PIG-L deacetylase family protein [Chthoniobacterales bacterium]
MLKLDFRKAKSLLFLGAHADDIEIGCGGTILKWAAANPGLKVHWVVFSAEGARRIEARRSAELLLRGASQAKVTIKQFKASFFPTQEATIKGYFETLKRSVAPDIVFTHYRYDRHQDHRLLSDLAWNTFRHHLILEYEVPKYDGDLGSPNLFIPLTEVVGRRKASHICRVFQTQRPKHWLTEDTFLALMRLRGVECASKYAEAFYCRKMVGS